LRTPVTGKTDIDETGGYVSSAAAPRQDGARPQGGATRGPSQTLPKTQSSPIHKTFHRRRALERNAGRAVVDQPDRLQIPHLYGRNRSRDSTGYQRVDLRRCRIEHLCRKAPNPHIRPICAVLSRRVPKTLFCVDLYRFALALTIPRLWRSSRGSRAMC